MTEAAEKLEETLEKPKIGRARNALFRRLLDLVVMPASRMAHQDRNMVGDILLDMLFHADDSDRALCAVRLASCRDIPKRLLRYLCQREFHIAKPLLEENEGLSSCDLEETAKIGGVEHRMAIAQRKLVPETVCLYLSQHAETAVLETMLANSGAALAEQTVDQLVARSREEASLCPLLIERLELKPSQAMAMFWWANGPTRKKILQRHAADRIEVIDTCKDVFEMSAAENWADPVVRQALRLIERRQRSRHALEQSQYDSLEHAINAAGLNGMDAQLAQEIGILAGLKPVTAAKLLSDRGGEGIAVMCKATGVNRDFLPVLWSAMKRPLELSEGVVHPAFQAVADTFEMLTVAKAQTTLRYWNWSLSAAMTPAASAEGAGAGQETEDSAQFSAAQRTVQLVFGN